MRPLDIKDFQDWHPTVTMASMSSSSFYITSTGDSNAIITLYATLDFSNNSIMYHIEIKSRNYSYTKASYDLKQIIDYFNLELEKLQK